MVRLKRAYDPPSPEDGQRLLVDRLWPRGLSKDRACIDRWLRDIAPSLQLRRWFDHDPQRWEEFQERYRQELQSHRGLLQELAEQAQQGTLTLVYAARDEGHNNALVLRQVLEEWSQPPLATENPAGGLPAAPGPAAAGAFTEQELGDWSTLRAIVAHLRGPDGCPWDREQTHQSIRENLLEEAYEALEALDSGNMDKLCQELGDVLMQVALHAQMASERGDFELSDVVRSISRKLVRRHPHVFGERRVGDAAEALAQWEALKREEQGDGEGLLSSLPRTLPALAHSQKLQGRARRAGFPIPQLTLEEIVQRLEALDPVQGPVGEMGEALFALSGLASGLGVDLEAALRQVNQRYLRHIQGVEAECRRQEKSWSELGPEERAALWEKAGES